MKTQSIRGVPLIIALAIAALAALLASPAAAAPEKGRYIVVLKDSVEHPGAIARAQIERHDGKLGFVYRHALKGYSAVLPKSAVEGLERDPRVKYVTPDHRLKLFAQTTPTGIDRVFATANESLQINGEDDLRVDADVAVIDTGIDHEHPDLDVVERTDCTIAKESGTYECVGDSGTDTNGHGTHVAGTAAAIDNGFGVVGIAPGARLWAVKVVTSGTIEEFESSTVAGVDWVTARAEEIEVVNMSLGCECTLPALNEAISSSVEAGIAYAIAAGNENTDGENIDPGSNPDVIGVSALADYDGKPGGEASPTCRNDVGADDTLASFSNWGGTIEVAAPGVCILSTFPNESYGTISGTSMASPHVAGAAALLAAQDNPENRADVEAIGETIFGDSGCPTGIGEGNCNWTDTSGDGIQEPLLDVSNEAVFFLAEPPTATTETATEVTVGSATLNATVNPNGAATTYQFEYGTTTEYDTKVPAEPKGIGSGTADVEVSEAIEGLEAHSEYHFRVVATNADGTAYGQDRVFTTGSEWTLQPTPNAQPEDASRLDDVSCASATACLAVGYDDYKGRGLAESWDGEGWTVHKGGDGRRPKAVSCPSATFCWAVGSKGAGEPLLEHWEAGEGGGWAGSDLTFLLSTPEGGSDLKLSDVSCSSETDCTLIGTYVKEGETRTLAERWNPEALKWEVQPTPTPESPGFLLFEGVSCAAASECVAVGYQLTSLQAAPLAMRWDGEAWASLPDPSPPGAANSTLTAVSCAAASECMVSGGYDSESSEGPFAARLDGEGWSQASSGLTGSEAPSDISCASTACVAVGVEAGKTLTQHWDGGEWTTQPSPNPEAGTPALAGVSCASAVACTAVGRVGGKTLALRFE